MLAALDTEAGRVREMMLLALTEMGESEDRRASTIEEPVWPVAPRMAIVGAMAERGRRVLGLVAV